MLPPQCIRGIGVAICLAIPALAVRAEDNLLFRKVDRGPINQTVVERGELHAAVAADIVCKLRNRDDNKPATTIRWVIDDGKMVKTGDKVIELDSALIRDRVRTLEIDVGRAEANFKAATAEFRAIEVSNKADIQAAQLGVDLATLENKTAASATSIEKQQLEVKVRRASLAAELAKEQAGAANEAAQKKMVEAAECEAEIARLELKKLADRDELQKKQGEMRVFAGQRALEAANSQSTGRTIKAEVEVASAKANFQAARAKLDSAKEELAACILTAPNDGLAVHYLSEQSRTGFGSRQQVVAEGEPVYYGQRMLQILDLGRTRVATRVHETAVRRVRTGQAVSMLADAFPNKMIAGEVSSVGRVAMQPDWRMSPDVKMYSVIVNVTKAIPGLKPGMTVEVSILIARKDAVVRIPVSALAIEGGRTFCYVKANDGAKKRAIRTGIRDDRFIEIIDGIKEDDEIVVNPRALRHGVGAASRQSTIIVESLKPADENGAAGRRSFVDRYGLTKRDLDFIRRVGGIATIVPERRFPQEVRRQGAICFGRVVGTTPALAEQQSLKLASGRFLTPIDQAEFKNVAVLGDSVAEALFSSEDAIGQTVLISGHMYVVIGVLANQPAINGRNSDVIIPLSTVNGRFGESIMIRTSRSFRGEAVAIHRLTIVAENPDSVPRIHEAIDDILTRRHDTREWVFLVPR